MNFIYIGASWCPYCVELKPKVDEIFGKNSSQLQYLEVTKENRKQIKEDYKISCIPAMIVIDDNNEIIETWHADLEQDFNTFISKYQVM